MQTMTAEEMKAELWAKFDETSAAMVKAKRLFREGTGLEKDVHLQRAMLAAIRCDLASLGEKAESTEPGD